MEWKIKVESLNNRRILIKFNPLKKSLNFIGQYKINNIWEDFYIDIYSININTSQISTIIYKIHENLDELINIYEKLSSELEEINSVEFTNI